MLFLLWESKVTNDLGWLDNGKQKQLMNSAVSNKNMSVDKTKSKPNLKRQGLVLTCLGPVRALVVYYSWTPRPGTILVIVGKGLVLDP